MAATLRAFGSSSPAVTSSTSVTVNGTVHATSMDHGCTVAVNPFLFFGEDMLWAKRLFDVKVKNSTWDMWFVFKFDDFIHWLILAVSTVSDVMHNSY